MYTNTYNYNLDSSSASTDLFSNLSSYGAGLIVLFVVLGLIAIGVAIFLIVAECKVFEKAGEKWWKALIPAYNTWIETKIAGLAWWWCPIIIGVSALTTFKNLSTVIGFVVVVITFNFNYNISKKFGKSNGFAVLLTLLPIIGIPILGFGSAKYSANAKTDKNGIFAVEKDLIK